MKQKEKKRSLIPRNWISIMLLIVSLFLLELSTLMGVLSLLGARYFWKGIEEQQ